ncbi:MAG TPA: hypothetical protein VGH73_02420 [Thermoanaerobaculia bacterium]
MLSAVGILTPWVGRLAEAAALPISGSIGAAPAVAPARPMSIGYVEGSDTILSFRSLPWEGLSLLSDSTPPEERFGYQVTPARELTLGNQNMASTVARINVHGLYPSGNWGTRETLESVDLEIYFPNPDPASSRPLPFHAWSFRRWPARNAGQRISFNMPVGIDGGPQISLIVGRRGEAQRQRYDANFTVDWASGRPKLQQGIYLLGLGPATWDSRVSLPAPGERQRIDLRSVVISVETSPLVRRLGH